MFEGQEGPQLSSSIASVYGCLKVSHVVLVLQHLLSFSTFLIVRVKLYQFDGTCGLYRSVFRCIACLPVFLARFLRLVSVTFRWDFVLLHIYASWYVETCI